MVALRRDFDPEARFRTEGVEERCTLALADLTDHDALVRVLNEHEVDQVFHLAAQTIVGTANRSPLATWDANVRGTYTLLEACRNLGTVRRVVVASSNHAADWYEEILHDGKMDRVDPERTPNKSDNYHGWPKFSTCRRFSLGAI